MLNRKKIILITVILILAVLAFFGVRYLYIHKSYTDYKVVKVIDEESANDNSEYYEFASGILKCNMEGLSYIEGDEILWNQPFSMKDLIFDNCGGYVAVGSKNSNEVYLFDKKGLISVVNASYPIMSMEVTKDGAIGTIQKEEDVNYIEILDQTGKKIVSIKTVLESNGYPLDMSMSDNGEKMVVSYLFFDSGIVSTKVVFYDFSDVDSSEQEKVSGGFNHYKQTVIPRVEFMDSDTACVFGDDLFTVYNVGSEPKISEENAIDSEIKSVFYSEDYFGIVTVNKNGNSPYLMTIYSKNGNEKNSFEFAFSYTNIKFAGSNILMYNESTCEIFNFQGVEKFKYTFDDHINCVTYLGWNKYILALSSTVEEIKLK